jgi:hypothetical protein
VLNFTGGVVDGQLLIFGASDAVTTIKHNNGGVGSVWLFDQKDHLLRGGDTLVFIYDLANTMWRQIGHSVSTLGPGTGDNVLMTNAAGQISFIANGTEADISFNITPKGAGFVKLNITSQFGALRVGAVAGGNYMEVYPERCWLAATHGSGRCRRQYRPAIGSQRHRCCGFAPARDDRTRWWRCADVRKPSAAPVQPQLRKTAGSKSK